MRPRLRASSLLARFSAMTLVLLLLLGAVLGHLLHRLIEARALASARDSAVLVARAGIDATLRPGDLERGFDAEGLDRLDRRLHAESLRAAGIQRIKLFDSRPTLVYSDDRSQVGTSAATSDNVKRALRGEVVGEFTEGLRHSGEGDRTLSVYVPLRGGAPGSAPTGVFEAYLDYSPVAAAIRSDLRVMYVALAACLAVLYVALYRIVAVASRRLRHQATHDSLTGLPNRAVLLDRVGQALAVAGRNRQDVAVMLIDLDRFKEINDTLGHSYGDDLLCEVGPRLRRVLRSGDTVARLGGDEFAVLLPRAGRSAEVEAVAERLLGVLHEPFLSNGMTIDVEASIGIALAPAHGTDTGALLRHADLALYAAKERTAGVTMFSAEEHATAPSRLSLLGDLRRALSARNELELHYQPKHALDDGRLEGVEALLRWQHPTRGWVMPADFIEVAETTGLIVPITEFVLQEALGRLRAWEMDGRAVPVAVNLSTRCLLDASLPELVARLLHERGVPAALLRLEITESALMSDPTRSVDVLRRLHELGVRLSIDDFGVGYTSMAWLRRLPVDELKIDRSFVRGLGGEEQDEVLVRSAVELGHNLGMTVVAEGVETREQVRALRAIGCDVAQGYHYARPMPAAALEAVLDACARADTAPGLPSEPGRTDRRAQARLG